MYSKIIAGYDGRPSSKDALALAKTIADATGAELTAAAIMLSDPYWGGPDRSSAGSSPTSARTSPRRRARSGLTCPSGRARPRDVAFTSSPSRRTPTSSWSAPRAPARSVRCSRATSRSACCTAHRARLRWPRKGYAEQASQAISEVTVGYDGSPEAHAAINDALEFARRAGAALKVVAVVEPPPVSYGKGANQGRPELTKDIEQIMHSRLDELLAELPDDVTVRRVLASGKPAEVLADEATADGGVLFVGSRGYGPLRRVLLGSVSRELVRSAPCAVILHPRSAEAEAPAMAGAARGRERSVSGAVHAAPGSSWATTARRPPARRSPGRPRGPARRGRSGSSTA